MRTKVGVLLVVIAGLLGALSPAASALTLEIPPTLNDQTRSVPVAGTVRAVFVRTDFGDVAVAAGKTLSLRVRETWNYARPVITHSLDDGVLVVRADCPDDPTTFNKCSGHIAIAVPFMVSVDAASSFGDVTTKALRGNERLASGFGSVRALQVAADRISTTSSYGDIELDLVAAPRAVVAESSFGDIGIGVPAGTYAVTADSGFGDTEITGLAQAADAAKKITARTSYGDVTIGRR